MVSELAPTVYSRGRMRHQQVVGRDAEEDVPYKQRVSYRLTLCVLSCRKSHAGLFGNLQHIVRVCTIVSQVERKLRYISPATRWPVQLTLLHLLYRRWIAVRFLAPECVMTGNSHQRHFSSNTQGLSVYRERSSQF